jgi:hypothetical protein
MLHQLHFPALPSSSSSSFSPSVFSDPASAESPSRAVHAHVPALFSQWKLVYNQVPAFLYGVIGLDVECEARDEDEDEEEDEKGDTNAKKSQRGVCVQLAFLESNIVYVLEESKWEELSRMDWSQATFVAFDSQLEKKMLPFWSESIFDVRELLPKSRRGISLQWIVGHYLGVYLKKDKTMRMSFVHDAMLTTQQLHYAATDAIVCVYLYEFLNRQQAVFSGIWI